MILRLIYTPGWQGGGGGGGASREDVVYEKASELLERLPEDYVEDDYKAKLQKLGGLAIPLNIFLFQVIDSLTVETTRQLLERCISRVELDPMNRGGCWGLHLDISVLFDLNVSARCCTLNLRNESF